MTENYPYLIERLLKRERPEEALAEAQHVDTYYLPEVADIFCEQGHEEMALRLVEERSAQNGSEALLQWLQRQHQNSRNAYCMARPRKLPPGMPTSAQYAQAFSEDRQTE